MSLVKPVVQTDVRTSWRFRLTSATIACLMLGGWAWWVNRREVDELASGPWIAAGTQGISSFVITLGMVGVVTWLFHRVPRVTQLILPAAITALLTGSWLAAAHQLAGTADVAWTIAPASLLHFPSTFLQQSNYVAQKLT